MKKKHIFIALIFLQIFACKNDNKPLDVEFRARIINARTDEILISRNFLFIDADTLRIKNENQIRGKIKANEEGLYFIYIYPEFQSVYLNPGDSLALHINLDEFDESLSFSGNLGFENNLLMELYLLNEKESEFFYQADFQFQPDDFLKKLDSFSGISQKIINNYQTELNKTTKKFKKIVDLWEKSLQYNLKEAYLNKHPKANLPPNYTNYHQILQSELPDPNIIYMYAFTENYIRSKIPDNITKSENWYFQTGKIIKTDVKDNKFKDNLLLKYCYRYIREKKLNKEDSVSRYYFKNIKNPSFTKYCLQHIQKNNRLQTGNKFPSVEWVNINNQPVKTDTLLKNKKVLLSFWDLKQRKNYISNLEKLKKIKQKFPELEIIILNTDRRLFDEWIMELPVNKNLKFYQIAHPNDKEKINPYHPAQVFLIENDTIKASMINMYSVDFETQLENFL